jgi:hypothetical protein
MLSSDISLKVEKQHGFFPQFCDLTILTMIHKRKEPNLVIERTENIL